jgi:FAD/FMN-containing dehydrogenase
MNNLEELKKIFKGDIAEDKETIEKYSHDYSIFTVRPKIVCYPKEVEDIKNLVRFVNKYKQKDPNLSLTGRSAGTDMSGGPLNESFILDFTRYFNHIIEINKDSVLVEPGVYFRDLEQELDKVNLMFPSYPASKHLCAIGGIVANNSGGEKSLAYGQTKNYVQELKVVLSDGEEHHFKPLNKKELQQKLQESSFEGNIFRQLFSLIEKNFDAIQKAKPQVSKNSAGYLLWDVWDKQIFDITKIIVGSQGTLGLITNIKLKLIPKKKFSRLAVVFLKELKQFAYLINTILQFKPESLEFYDDQTLNIAVHLLPELIKNMKQNLLTLAFNFLPELWMTIKNGGIPKIILLIELTSDDEQELTKRLANLYQNIKNMKLPIRLVKSEKEAEKYWTVRRQSFALLHGHNPQKSTVPFIDDIIVKPEYLPEFLPKINALLAPYQKQLIYTIAGHAGDGNFHIIPLMDLKDQKVQEIIPKIAQQAYALVKEYKGSITAEHNDGLIRTPYLNMMYNEHILHLFKEVKNIFDPKNIFNPRKKVDGDLKYSLNHIKEKVAYHGS